MKKLAFILLSTLFCFATTNLFAHALWIEAPATGKAGQPQTVKVYYGEFATNEREHVDKWYSDVKDFTLWLVGPNQQKTQLKLVPGTDYVESSFTPDADGVYVLQVSHEAKDLGGSTKYHFLAGTHVTVGKTAALAKNTNVLSLHVDPASSTKVNSSIKLIALLKDAAAKDKTVSVFSPSGWSKEIKTNENGIAEFTALWPGKYVVEISDMDKTPGQHNGKDFTGTWKGATYSFEVKK